MPPLITALMDPRAYDHPVDRVELIETHISWVLLAGDFAYKIKKPVVLPFLDFGSLPARRRFCEDELRLNRRLAPELYLEVVAITGSPGSPHMGGTGEALEYAVRMRRFPQDALFDHLLGRGALSPQLIERLAERIATFHAAAPPAGDSRRGAPARVLHAALDNFQEMIPHAGAPRRAALERLAGWTGEIFERLRPAFVARQRAGRIRECHGDLHLRNIVAIDGEPVAFDCIEFSEELRWIDVISEVAFLVMDFDDRGRRDLGCWFLDTYLAGTGDYAGVAVLRFYLVYRALVRAKIHDLRARQVKGEPREAARLQEAADHYVTLADELANGRAPALVLMHGFSGAGKSRVAAALAPALGAIRIRSDVERKRLFGLDATARTHSGVDAGIYARQASARVYAQMADLAAGVLDAGYPVILDAAFLTRAQREPMRQLAKRRGVPLRIVDCTAADASLRERIATRAREGRDPSEATTAVLSKQMASHDPMVDAEMQHLVRCDMDGIESANVAACVARVLDSLGSTRQAGRQVLPPAVAGTSVPLDRRQG